MLPLCLKIDDHQVSHVPLGFLQPKFTIEICFMFIGTTTCINHFQSSDLWMIDFVLSFIKNKSKRILDICNFVSSTISLFQADDLVIC